MADSNIIHRGPPRFHRRPPTKARLRCLACDELFGSYDTVLNRVCDSCKKKQERLDPREFSSNGVRGL